MVNMQDESSLIVVGKIVGVYGIKGWSKILSFTRPKENIFNYGPWLVKQDSEWQEIQLLQGRPQGKGLIASLEGITDRNQAMALVGSELAIDRDQLPAAEEGEFYWHDLIDMQVINNISKFRDAADQRHLVAINGDCAAFDFDMLEMKMIFTITA